MKLRQILLDFYKKIQILNIVRLYIIIKDMNLITWPDIICLPAIADILSYTSYCCFTCIM